MKQCKLLLVLLAFVLVLCCCNNTEVPPVTGEQENSVQAQNELCLIENGSSSYTIILPDRCSTFATDVGTYCWKMFKETYGAELPINNDWVSDPSAIPTDTFEILIGVTNRAESAEAYANLGDNMYRVTCQNNRVVIVTAGDYALQEAVDVFFNNVQVDANGRVTVPVDLDISKTPEQQWLDHLVGVPMYDGGDIIGDVLEEPTGFAEENPSAVMCVNNTNAEEFAAFIEKVKNEGFTVLNRADWGTVTAYQCDKDDVSFYTYFTAGTGEVRVILDNSKTASLEEFNYIREKAEGEYNEIYLYGLKQYDPDNPLSLELKTNGQLMLIKLADNSLVVIDGGRREQGDAEEFMRIAREITGIPEGEKIRIACWFITHKHTDHMWGFDTILKACTDELILERMMYNHMNGQDFVYDAETPNESYHIPYADVLYHMPRTGETIQFGDVTMDVLYTHEDLRNFEGGVYRTADNYNNSCTVLRVNIDGKICLILGDIDIKASEIMMTYYNDDQLKADMVQISHHSINAILEFYEKTDGIIALYPCSQGYAMKNNYMVYNYIEERFAEKYFSGQETVGIRVVNGEMEVTYRRPVVYE